MSTQVKMWGMGTGLNTGEIIEKLLTPEGLKIKTLESKQSVVANKRDLWKEIESSLYDLNDALHGISKMSGGDNNFEIGKVDRNGNIVFDNKFSGQISRGIIQEISISEEGYVDYVERGFPKDGIYEINVEQMWRHATAQSNKKYNAGQQVGISGEIYLGDSEEIYINRRDTIDVVAEKINNAKKKDGSALGIRATVENGYLTLEEDINNNQLRASDGEDTYTLYMLGLMDVYEWSDGGTELANKIEAQQTIINVNGETFKSNNEVFTDAIEGLELTIQQITENPIYIFIQSWDDTILPDEEVEVRKDAIIDIFHKINEVLKMISDNSKYDELSNSGGLLLSDYMSRSLKNKMMDSLSSRYNGGDLNYIYNLGVERNEEGIYTIDDNLLSHRIKNRWDDVYTMLMDKNNGIFVQFNDVLKNYIVGNNSMIEDKVANFEATIEKYDFQIEKQTRHMEKKREILEAQFRALEQTFSSNNVTMGYLINYDNLMGSFKEDK